MHHDERTAWESAVAPQRKIKDRSKSSVKRGKSIIFRNFNLFSMNFNLVPRKFGKERSCELNSLMESAECISSRTRLHNLYARSSIRSDLLQWSVNV